MTTVKFLTAEEAKQLAELGLDVRGWWVSNESLSDPDVYDHHAMVPHNASDGKVGWRYSRNRGGVEASPTSRFWIELE